METIRSASNTRVKWLSKLVRDAKTRRKEGVWVIEGVRLAEEALLSGCQLVSAFVVEGLEGERNMKLLAELGERGIEPVHLAKGVMRESSDTTQPQGVTLVVKTPSHEEGKLLAAPGPIVILDRIRDPGNLGTIARSAAAAGGAGLVLTAETVDPGNPKALRASAGALLRLPWIRLSGPEEIRDKLTRPIYSTAGQGGSAPDALPLGKPHAVLMGHEAEGPDKRWGMLVDGLITIPMEVEVESLNVAVAASVILFEAARLKRG